MFFIFGINNGSKILNFRQNIICQCCGRYGALEVFKQYTYFSLFFIPMFFWNKRYYVRTTCCNNICQIDNELGKKIERGEVTNIDINSLKFASGCGNVNIKHCAVCGYETKENFDFCPKCGRKF